MKSICKKPIQRMQASDKLLQSLNHSIHVGADAYEWPMMLHLCLR